MFIKQSDGISFRCLSTRMDETVQNMRTDVHGVGRARNGGDATKVGATEPNTRQRSGREERCLLRDEICSVLKDVLEAVARRGRGSLPEESCVRMLVEQFWEEVLQSFAKVMREWIFARRSLCKRNGRVMFVKSKFITEKFCLSLNDYDLGANSTKISRIKDCVLHEQTVYSILEFGDERKVLNSFVEAKDENDEGEEIWVAKVLIMFHFSVQRSTESAELVLVKYVKCLLSLNSVHRCFRK